MMMHEDLPQPDPTGAICSECGQRMPSSQGDAAAHPPGSAECIENGVTIARFKNAAEAGYFAEELKDVHNLPVVVRLIEDFDAIAGLWNNRFALVSPSATAAEATAQLQDLIAATEESDEWPEPVLESPEYPSDVREVWTPPAIDRDGGMHQGAPQSSVNWVPILLTLAAGSAVFLIARKGPNPPLDRANAAGQQRADLWEQLATDGEPWVQKINEGRGTRELRIVPGERRAVLREDSDGDGLYEREIALER